MTKLSLVTFEALYGADFSKSYQQRVLEVDTNADVELWNTPLGEFWVPVGDMSFPSTINEALRGIYGPVNKGDVILDCGANIGALTRRFLNDGAGMVVVIEPLPQHVECLKRNLVNELEDSVRLIPRGVWLTEVEKATLNRGDIYDSSDSLILARGSRSVQVSLTTIDQIVNDLGITPTFIKMDIEGSEIPALTGGKETIGKFHPRLAVAAEHFISDGFTIPAAIESFALGVYNFQITQNNVIYANVK